MNILRKKGKSNKTSGRLFSLSKSEIKLASEVQLLILLGSTKPNNTMKNKEFWKSVIQLAISVLTAALTAISTTSCMGHGPVFF